MPPVASRQTMDTDRRTTVSRILDATVAALRRFQALDPAPVLAAVDAMVAAFERGGKVLIFGNGGSAADAQHLAAELVGRFETERAPLAAIALSTDTSVLTCVGNDYGYERVFARQIDALGRAGDVAMGISTSGASPNVIAALRAATARGLRTVAMTGRDGGVIGAAAEIHINVPETSTARIQEVHAAIIHVLCALIDGRDGSSSHA